MEPKKGTTTVGIVCKDGLVIAADRRATAGGLIVDKKAKKIHEITNYVAVTIAGGVSDAQLLVKLIGAESRLKALRTSRKTSVREMANLLASMVYSSIRSMSMLPAVVHFILAGVDEEGFQLYDIFPDGSITEITDFVSSGSGSVIAYGVLESQYKPELTVEEGMKLCITAINSALQRDSASGNGIDVIQVTKSGTKRVFGEEVPTMVRK